MVLKIGDMRKIKNIKLEEIVTLFPMLNEESQRRILGGTAPTPTSPPTNPNEEDPFAIPGVTPPCPTTNPSDTGGGTTGGSPTEEPTTSDTDGDPINPYDNPDLPRSIAVPDSESDENADLPDTTTEDAVVADTSTTNTTDIPTPTPDDSKPTDTALIDQQTVPAETYTGGVLSCSITADGDIIFFIPTPSTANIEEVNTFPNDVSNSTCGVEITPYTGFEGEVKQGKAFAFHLRNGIGLNIAPCSFNICSIEVDCTTGMPQVSTSEAFAVSTEVGVSYGGSFNYEMETTSDNTTHTFSIGAYGFEVSYSVDDEGNHNLFVGLNVGGDLAIGEYGVEGDFKSGINISF